MSLPSWKRRSPGIDELSRRDAALLDELTLPRDPFAR
jgi:hypothetical protein